MPFMYYSLFDAQKAFCKRAGEEASEAASIDFNPEIFGPLASAWSVMYDALVEAENKARAIDEFRSIDGPQGHDGSIDEVHDNIVYDWQEYEAVDLSRFAGVYPLLPGNDINHWRFAVGDGNAMLHVYERTVDRHPNGTREYGRYVWGWYTDDEGNRVHKATPLKVSDKEALLTSILNAAAEVVDDKFVRTCCDDDHDDDHE